MAAEVDGTACESLRVQEFPDRSEPIGERPLAEGCLSAECLRGRSPFHNGEARGAAAGGSPSSQVYVAIVAVAGDATLTVRTVNDRSVYANRSGGAAGPERPVHPREAGASRTGTR